MKKLSVFLCLLLLLALFTACGTAEDSSSSAPETSPSPSAELESPTPTPLPAGEPDINNEFGVDMNINIETIDNWLNRDDVVYRDMRMLFDPAEFGDIGGEADLTRTIEGFKVVPYPYIASLPPIPVGNAYAGECLYSLTWNEDGTIATADANYEESVMILEELFPKDKAIFLMCGGGGYAGMTRALLIFLGWDASKLYNVGGNWGYTGTHSLELVVSPEDASGNSIYATWRADYAYLDFSRLNPIS